MVAKQVVPHPKAPGAHLTFREVSKRFGPVEVLHRVNLEIAAAERHAVVGENGAGKSTLMKILCGLLRPSAGSVHAGGSPIHSLADARAQGIAFVHQELSLVPTLSIAENCVLGAHPSSLGFVRQRRVTASGRRALDLVGADLAPETPVSRLSLAERQLVEIAKALLKEPAVLVLDEPTSSLTPAETERLFGLLKTLNQRGLTIVYVSHRVDEVYELCQRATVLRDGHLLATYDLEHVPPRALVQSMVGRDLALPARPRSANRGDGEAILELDDLSGPGITGASFAVHAGEIFGIGGLVGSGRSELLRVIMGLERRSRGSIRIGGRLVKRASPPKARKLGVAYVPEDRQGEGLAIDLSVASNAALPSVARLSPGGLLRRRSLEKCAQEVIASMEVRPPDPSRLVRTLSGGNQQKLVFGKWLPLAPRLLILDEPTRGIDVGTKSEIHNLVRRLAAGGLAVLLVSSDLPELLDLSHRILVLRDGRPSGFLEKEHLNEQAFIDLAAGTSHAETR